jgi:serine protease Do
MTGWVIATATTAILGAAAAGSATYAQSTKAVPEESVRWHFPEAAQAVRVLTGSGSQIGVTIRDLTEDDLKGKAGASGVVIDGVEDDSPASKAGFKAGDVVVEFDGERVRSARQLTRLVQETAVGRPVPAAVMRDGQRVALNVQPREGDGFRYFDRSGTMSGLIARRPVPKSGPLPPAPPPPPSTRWEMLPEIGRLFGGGRLGITVDNLSPQLAAYFGTKQGVLVQSVADDSAAAKAGLKAGDVITGLDGGAIDAPADLVRRSQRLEDGDEFTLAVVRDKKEMTLKGKVDAPRSRRSTKTIL